MSGSLIFAGICLHGGGCISVRPRVVAAAAASERRRGRSLYEVLRVRETASPGEIKAAYRAMAKRYHPDVAAGRGGDEFFEIHQAYEALSDPAARARYDVSIGKWRQGASADGMTGAAQLLRCSRWETDQCW